MASVDDRTIDSSDAGEPQRPDVGSTVPPHGVNAGATVPPSSGADATMPPPAGGWQDPPAAPRKRAAESMVGQSVGRYQVLQLLGEGGFGAVYLAEQVEPVRRKVALKVMRSGSDREDLVARFEAERQAMAVMNHPGVAKVWDAGALPDGKPFFAMEFVPGKPLDEFADAERLDLRARTRLFLQVCDAIQHAHTKGVVHRDLKPGNILVYRDAEAFHVKVIDFGIAKAVNTTLHSRSFETQFGHFVGTPAYMSPEQADGKADIDTRSDVYTLGVILYELLTGWLPLDQKTLQGVGVSELSRVVREYRPPSPQQRIRQVERDDLGRATTIAHARGTDPATLGRSLRGDVERIIFKSLEKDREVRYQSASALGDDLRAWLAGDPVSAGPPGTAYRLRKLVAKHKVAVATVGLGLCMIVASSIALAFLWRSAVTQEQRARQTLSTFLTALRSADSQGSGSQVALDIKGLLAQVEKAVTTQLQDDPSVAAELFDTVGIVYLASSDYDSAARNLKAALEVRELLAATDPDPSTELDLVRTRRNIARAQYFLKDYPASEEGFTFAVEGLDRLASNEVRERAESRVWLAAAQVELKKIDDADRNASMALYLLREEFGEESEPYGSTLFARARQLQNLSRLDDAAAAFSRVVAIFSKVSGPDDWRVGRALRQLSIIHLERREIATALPILQRALPLMEARFGETNPMVNSAQHDLAETMLQLGMNLDETRDVARRALAGWKSNGTRPIDTAKSLTLLSRIDEARGDAPGAQKNQRDAVETLRLATPQGSPEMTRAVARLGHLLVEQGLASEAGPLLLEAIRAAEREGDGSKDVREQAQADLNRARNLVPNSESK
jgi:tetratricopeptide (TPR) repeat protein/predicted Ser/Thr protein kinase